MRYIYSLIRFVPDPARGEFVNVGAIAGCEKAADWQLQLVSNHKRARALDDRDAFKGFLCRLDDLERTVEIFQESLESLVESELNLDEAWLRRLFEESNNILQLSEPLPILADSAEEALEVIFGECVLDPASNRLPYTRKTRAYSALRTAYLDSGLRRGEHLLERVNVEGQHHHERFDFVVRNGAAVQLCQSWSFQLPAQDQLAEQLKAWAWSVQDLREKGGVIQAADGSTVQVPAEVDIEAVYVPPAQSGPQSAFREALDAFRKVNVVAIPYENAEEVGRRAVRLLERAGVSVETGLQEG